MSVLPDSTLEAIEFCEQHWPVWELDPAAVGLLPATILSIKAATVDARAKYELALAARQASKAATGTLHNYEDVMRGLTTIAIQTIRLYAESTNDPNVFDLAQIPPPAAPTAALPPTAPIQIRASIEPTGALTLAWKAGPTPPSPINGQNYDSSTSRVVYTILRKINDQAAFAPVGTQNAARSGKRGTTSWTDSTLPRGAENIQYTVVGQRTGVSIPGLMSEVFSVVLGVGGGGGLAILGQGVVPGAGAGAKIAA